MEEERNISAKQLLTETVDLLNEISVPVRYAYQIARPLSVAVQNIQACIDAMADEPAAEEGGEENV